MANLGETQTTTVLRMIWSLIQGGTLQWNLPNPISGIQKTTVDDFMSEMIDDQALLKNNSEASDIKDAYIYQTNKIDLSWQKSGYKKPLYF